MLVCDVCGALINSLCWWILRSRPNSASDYHDCIHNYIYCDADCLHNYIYCDADCLHNCIYCDADCLHNYIYCDADELPPFNAMNPNYPLTAE